VWCSQGRTALLTPQEAWTVADDREGWRAQRSFADRSDDDDNDTN